MLALGRLARNKGYDLLMQAFTLLADREPEARLHLAVGGASLTQLEETILAELEALVASLNLKDKVVFGRFIPSRGPCRGP